MHLFNVASYQYDELKRVFREKEMRPLAARFCERLLALDVWRIGAWILPVHYFQQLRACQDVLAGNLVALARLGAVVDVEELREMGILEETIDHLLLSVWQGLRALGATYEERIREWGMPTYLGITDAGLRNEG